MANEDTAKAATKKRRSRQKAKKNVILDFSKKFKRKGICDGESGKLKTTSKFMPDRETTTKTTTNPKAQLDDTSSKKSNRPSRSRSSKLTLTTSNKDYGGKLGLPDQVAQGEFESTGQFFRRLDRLVAKAKVEASLESRFDMNLSEIQGQAASSTMKRKVDEANKRDEQNVLEFTKRNKRRKRR